MSTNTVIKPVSKKYLSGYSNLFECKSLILIKKDQFMVFCNQKKTTSNVDVYFITYTKGLSNIHKNNIKIETFTTPWDIQNMESLMVKSLTENHIMMYD
jgi:hypothetical protein